MTIMNVSAVTPNAVSMRRSSAHFGPGSGRIPRLTAQSTASSRQSRRDPVEFVELVLEPDLRNFRRDWLRGFSREARQAGLSREARQAGLHPGAVGPAAGSKMQIGTPGELLSDVKSVDRRPLKLYERVEEALGR
jgi:hypothetical protein